MEDDPFDRKITDTLFVSEDKLKHSYIPDNLPRREEQIKGVKFQLLPALRNNCPSNFLIYGKTGTGKTAVTQFVSRQLTEKAQKTGISNIHTLYINCRRATTETQVMREISNVFSTNRIAPSQGWGIKDHYDFLVKTLDGAGGIFIIALDEIDQIKDSGILYNLTRLPTKNSKISIIGISNRLDFIESLDPRTQSSLGEEQLTFPPYTAEDIRIILNQRVKIAVKENVLNDDVIPICAALSAREHGDARKAIDLLRVAIKLAEYDQKNVVDKTYVYRAQQKLEMDKYNEVLRTLPIQTKLVLLSVIAIERSGLQPRNKTTSTLYEFYKSFSDKVHWSSNVLTQGRVSDILSELDMLGLINAKTISFGRGGRTKQIELCVPVEVIANGLKDDGLLSDYISNISTKTAIQKKLE